jgi:hypothetical protein
VRQEIANRHDANELSLFHYWQCDGIVLPSWVKKKAITSRLSGRGCNKQLLFRPASWREMNDWFAAGVGASSVRLRNDTPHGEGQVTDATSKASLVRFS